MSYIDEEIFKSFNPDSNDFLSKLNKIDKKEFLLLLNDFFIELRSELYFDCSYTFGLELEVDKCDDIDLIDSYISKHYSDWLIKPEVDIPQGAEAVSSILIDNEANWNNLDYITLLLSKHSQITDRTSVHVHVGSHLLGIENDNFINFIKFWCFYEKLFMRFCHGEFLSERKAYGIYYRELFDVFKLITGYIFKEEKFSHYVLSRLINKSFNINFCNSKMIGDKEENATIEFRCPSGTFSPAIIQNNVNLFLSIIKYVTSNNYDSEYINFNINYLLNNENKVKDFRNLYIDDALKLSDLMYDNNLDKIYFMRQYIKDGSIATTPFQRSKQFVR